MPVFVWFVGFCLFLLHGVCFSMDRLVADFNQPTDVSVAANGHVYVLDGVNARVKVFDQFGGILFEFGDHGSEEGTFNRPMGLAVADSRVYVADSNNHRINIYGLQGNLLETLDLSAGSQPQEPVAVAVFKGEIFWSDRKNHQVCRLRLEKSDSPFCWGSRGEKAGEFQFPFQLTIDAEGYVHVVDVLNQRVQQFHRSGRFIISTPNGQALANGLYRPNGITFINDNTMLVSDAYRGTIAAFRNYQFLGILAENKNQPIALNSPVGLSYHEGTLYVAEAKNNSIRVLGEDSFFVDESGKDATIENSVFNNHCTVCHASWLEPGSSQVHSADAELPVSSEAMCYSCHHGAVIDSRTRIGSGAQHPGKNHPSSDDKDTKSNDTIAEGFKLLPGEGRSDNRLGCGACHTPHHPDQPIEKNTLYPEHHNHWLRVANHNGKLCVECHASKENADDSEKRALNTSNHPLGVIFAASPNGVGNGYVTENHLQKGLPEKLLSNGASLGKNQELICQSCHQIHGGFSSDLIAQEEPVSKLCESCHQKAYSQDLEQAHSKGIHPVNISLKERDKPVKIGDKVIEKVTCLTCHSVHDGKPRTANIVKTVEATERLCKTCHADQHADNAEAAREKNIHPVNLELEEPVQIGERTVERLGCLSCHSMHSGKPNTAALHVSDKGGELCNHCHETQTAVVQSDHNFSRTQTAGENILGQSYESTTVCGSCHSMHRAEAGGVFQFIGAVDELENQQELLTRDRLCLSCHKEKGMAEDAVVEHYTHPSRSMTLRSQKEQMPLLNEAGELAEFGAIACVTCHSAHEWSVTGTNGDSKVGSQNRTGNAHNSFLKIKSPSESFCIECHGRETIIKYKYYHHELARQKRLPYLAE